MTGVQTCALPISDRRRAGAGGVPEGIRRAARLRPTARARQARPRACSWGVGRLTPASLCCSRRGRIAELATRASLAALGQRRRVSSRSARDRAPTPTLRCSATPKSPARGRARRAESAVACAQVACHDWFSKGRAGRPRRAYETPSSTELAARARQRASSSCSPRLSECSERSSRNEFRGGAVRSSSAGQSASADRLIEAPQVARSDLAARPATRRRHTE